MGTQQKYAEWFFSESGLNSTTTALNNGETFTGECEAIERVCSVLNTAETKEFMIKLEEKEVAMFRQMQDTSIGTVFRGFVEKMIDHLCDVRNMPNVEKEEMQARLRAAVILEKELLDRIRSSSGNKPQSVSQYE